MSIERMKRSILLAAAVLAGCGLAAVAQTTKDNRVLPPRVAPPVPPRVTPPVPPRPTFMPPPMVQPFPRILAPNSAPSPFGEAPRPLPRVTPGATDPIMPRTAPRQVGEQAAQDQIDRFRRANFRNRFYFERFGGGGSREIGFTSVGGAFYTDELGYAHGLNYPDEFGYRTGCGPTSGRFFSDGFGGHGSDFPRLPREGTSRVDTEGPIDLFLIPHAPPDSTLQAADVAKLPIVERANLALSLGYVEDATSLFREHLAAQPNDATSMRGLALSLLYERDLQRGTAMMLAAYQADPTLAVRRIEPGWLPDSGGGLRDRVNETVNFAHRTKRPEAWLTVLVLMQAEGRSAVALKNFGKAREAGLDPALLARLEAALKR